VRGAAELQPVFLGEAVVAGWGGESWGVSRFWIGDGVGLGLRVQSSVLVVESKVVFLFLFLFPSFLYCSSISLMFY